MIPPFDHSNVIPPFLPGSTPADPASVSPYKATLPEFVAHFNTSDERRKILVGFLQFRQRLKTLGVRNAFQWIDGSFVENVEKVKSRAPNDMDLITFGNRPLSKTADADWQKFFSSNPDIFSPKRAKTLFLCDAYYIDLNLPQHYIVKQVSYWFGLFSHQRDSYLWKGLIELTMSDDEAPLLTMLTTGATHAP